MFICHYFQRLGYNVKRHLNEEIVYRDRESQINAIEETFKAAEKPIHKHYSKPNVHALEVLPVLPDFTLWRYPCAQVSCIDFSNGFYV